MTISRRDFFKLGAIAGIAGCKSEKKYFYPGSIQGAQFKFGHILRDGQPPAIQKTIDTNIAIIGGGISGLSAALELERLGIRDVTLLELDSHLGGNSISGKNEVSGYPWGAHYLPVPGKDAEEVVKLLDEIGVISGRDPSGSPLYKEEYICFEPEERLFINGHWQDGIIPTHGVPQLDKEEFKRFFSITDNFKSKVGSDGLPAFTIPLEKSSTDPEIVAFDAISFEAYLKNNNFKSEYLFWYLNYCCRDDYGADISRVSAWAGLHYFAGRKSYSSKKTDYQILTWPQGNGWLVEKMRMRLKCAVFSSTLAFKIQNEESLIIDCFNTASLEAFRIRAKHAIFCAPHFTLKYIAPWAVTNNDQREYAPWMVANITLNDMPADSAKGIPWDSVFYKSRSLGYVSATNQSYAVRQSPTVWTYYLPLDEAPPPQARTTALGKTIEDWQKIIVEDLEHVHPDIHSKIDTIDVWVWGHGMPIPSPGFRSHTSPTNVEKLFFAHSDMSGISIFEEAYYQGVNAARRVAPL